MPPQRLVECVPNFSEGRNPALLAALCDIFRAQPEVWVLRAEQDADHHRAVITAVGTPETLAEAAVLATGLAARQIDLRRHRGVHPRLGATDVIPFVPLAGVTLDDCARLADWTAAEIWRRYQIPTYLYEAAARRPERQHLEQVRRGGFEERCALAAADPLYLPDFGPDEPGAAVHPSAGATIVGARPFLIAWNIDLDTADLGVARAVARAVRTSSGGLPALKALGVFLAARQCAQVTMNLTDFQLTSLAQVWQAIAREAECRGARPVASELIGLIPKAALDAAAVELLRLRDFSPDRILENALASAVAASHLAPATETPPAMLESALTLLRNAASVGAPLGACAAPLLEQLAATLKDLENRLASPLTPRPAAEQQD